jgi:sugar transferase (PEP-CTERM system associated)
MKLFSPGGLANRLTLLATGDLACVEAATRAGFWALAAANASRAAAEPMPALGIALPMLWMLLLYLRDFYAIARPRSKATAAANLLMVALGAGVLVATAAMAAPALNLGRRFYLTQIISATALLAVWRLVVFARIAERASIAVRILGGGMQAELLAREIRRHAHLGYRVVDFPAEADSVKKLAVGDLVGLVAGSTLPQIHPAADVLVVTDPERPLVPIRELLAWRMAGTQVFDFESFYEHLTGKIPLPLVREAWLVFAPGFGRASWSQRLKRIVDIAGAVAIGLLAAPLMVLVGVLIKLDSAGPVLYSQERVGLNGKVFRLYKFRSMRSDAEKLSGAVWAARADSRVTRIGRMIRRLRFDELPQLWNVLKGEMSLVGPRPERPEIVQRLAKAIPLYHYRHFTRPGITGWAQVCFPYGATVEDALEKLSYDLYYIKNWSLAFDVQITLQTVKVMLLGRGSR